jgi:hypothetical protein
MRARRPVSEQLDALERWRNLEQPGLMFKGLEGPPLPVDLGPVGKSLPLAEGVKEWCQEPEETDRHHCDQRQPLEPHRGLSPPLLGVRTSDAP